MMVSYQVKNKVHFSIKEVKGEEISVCKHLEKDINPHRNKPASKIDLAFLAGMEG